MNPFSRNSLHIMEQSESKERKHLFILVGFLGLFLFTYTRIISFLVKRWYSDDMYSYAFLIPAISLYLLFVDRRKIHETPIEKSYFPGYILFLGGISLLVLGKAGSIEVIQELSILLTLMGLVIILFGRKVFSRTWFPISYLLFMIPVWEIVTNRLHPPFQLFSSTIGVRLMHLIGIPAHQSGIFIELPNIILKVAKVCSGVNYLIAIIAIGIPLCYLYVKGVVKRILIISSAVVIAILFNGIRVAMVGYFAYHTGRVHGPGDLFRALIISAVGFFVLFVGIWIFGESGDEIEDDSSSKVQTNPHDNRWNISQKKKFSPIVPAIILLFLAGAYVNFFQPSSVALSSRLENIPRVVGKWRGNDSPPAGVLRNISFDDTISREYQDRGGRRLGMFIGYYAVQKQGRELLNYRTNNIFGRGEKFTLTSGDVKIPARFYVVKKGDKKKLVLFWFDVNGKNISRKYSVLFQTIMNVLFHGRKNGAVVMIARDMEGRETEKDALKTCALFIKAMYPYIHTQLRGEIRG